jgi:hypothetical protein
VEKGRQKDYWRRYWGDPDRGDIMIERPFLKPRLAKKIRQVAGEST